MDAKVVRLLESRPALPTVDDIIGVRGVKAKLAALRDRQDRLAREIREAIAAAPTAKATAAERLYAGLDADDAIDPGLDARVAELRKARRICADAIAMGEAELKRIVRQAAPALLEPLRAWHRDLVTEAARCMVVLQVLQGAEQAVLADISDAALPAGIVGELLYVTPGDWLVERLLSDGVLTGSEEWLPSHLVKPTAAATSLVGNAIAAVRRAAGAKPTGKPTGPEGHELWA